MHNQTRGHAHERHILPIIDRGNERKIQRERESEKEKG